MKPVLKHSTFRWVIVALLFFITIVNYIDRSAISFALNTLKINFHLTMTELGWILGVFGITIFLGGIWVDKYKPKWVMAIAVGFWIISMFSTAAATGFIIFAFFTHIIGYC